MVITKLQFIPGGLKGTVHSKMEILSSFSHSQVVPNLYEFCRTQKKIFFF